MISLMKQIKDSIYWLLNSKIIVDIDKANEIKSVAAWYEEYSGEYSFLYSEICGYYLTFLSNIRKYSIEKIIEEKEKQIINWLINKMYDRNVGAFYCRQEKNGQILFNHCSFDNGIILNGILNANNFKNNKLSEISNNCRDWLINKMQLENGAFIPKINLKEGFKEDISNWSKQSGSYHAKISIALLHLNNIIQESKIEKSIIKICNYTLTKQQKDGRFITSELDKSTYLHPHCYSIEGLIIAGKILHKNEYIDAGINGIKWINNTREKNSSLFTTYYQNGYIKNEINIDAFSQYLRLQMIAYNELNLKLDKEQLQKDIKLLLSFQNSSNSIHNGGFYYGTNNHQIINHLNAHSTMFALQTLIYYNMFIENTWEFNPYIYI